MHPLAGAHLKLDRADIHIRALNDDVVRFLKEQSHRVLEKFDPA
jgi:hypothetical protein